MFVELRTYTAVPGKLPALHQRFREHTVAMWKTHGWRCSGIWTYKHGGPSDCIVYMLEWEDHAERDAAFKSFVTDPAWLQVKAESERDGPLVASIQSDILVPTDYSPAEPA